MSVAVAGVSCVRCGAATVTDEWQCASCGFRPAVEDGVRLLAPDLAHGSGEDASYCHEALARAEQRHFWFQARSRLIVDALRAHFPGATSFLDLGCGNGGVAADVQRAWPSLRVVGADVRLEGLRHGRALAPEVEFLQMDLRTLPWSEAFDVVGAFDVIEHLDDDVEALAHMRSAVKPGGGVILTVPQHRWLWSAVDDFSRHRRRYDRRGLTALLTRAGFRLVWATSFMALLLPLLMLSRLRPRDQASFDPTAELRIGDLANRTLGIVCAVERRLIHAGVRLPAGGSLIAVARRS